MTGSHNLASLSQAERTALQADLLACRIRHQLGSLKGKPRQDAGKALLEMVPSRMREPVVERLKARAK